MLILHGKYQLYFDKHKIVIGRRMEERKCTGYKCISNSLILAWGITIRKSQGLTLDKFVDIGKDLFEAGQMYVALSELKV